MRGNHSQPLSVCMPPQGQGDSLTPLQWISAASAVPHTAEEMQLAVPSSRNFSLSSIVQKGEGDCGSFCFSEEDSDCPPGEDDSHHAAMQKSPHRSVLQSPPSMASPEIRHCPELGASAPAGIPRTEGPEAYQRDCSNPLAHQCLACREKQMANEFAPHIPGYMAAENGVTTAPCCALSSALHTIVHVCDCMAPFELDRALAVENLRLERVRDAHAVVLTIARKYGVESVLEDPDLMLIVYKYDEMMRMYAMMGAPVHLRPKHSYFRKVGSSAASDCPAGRKKRNQSAEEEMQCDPHFVHEELQDPECSAPAHVELDERLREAMRQQFGLSSFGTLTSMHVPPADESWNLAVQEPHGLKIFFRRHASSTLLSVRVEGTVGANILNIISVLNEMDLYKDWIPYYSFPIKLGLREVRKLYQFGRVEQIDLLHLDFPWPMSNRDCCVEIWAADDLDHTNRFFIRITSLDGESENPRVPVTVPLPSNKTLRLYCEGAVILVPRGRDETFIELFWTLDPKVHVSDYIVNFFTKVFAKSSFQAFCKVCAAASGGEHARRRENCPLLYGFVEKRLLEVEKAYERKKGSMSSFTVDGSYHLASPGSPEDLGARTHHANGLSSGVKGHECREAIPAKKSRGGKFGVPFRRRRSSFMSEATKS